MKYFVCHEEICDAAEFHSFNDFSKYLEALAIEQAALDADDGIEEGEFTVTVGSREP